MLNPDIVKTYLVSNQLIDILYNHILHFLDITEYYNILDLGIDIKDTDHYKKQRYYYDKWLENSKCEVKDKNKTSIEKVLHTERIKVNGKKHSLTEHVNRLVNKYYYFLGGKPRTQKYGCSCLEVQHSYIK